MPEHVSDMVSINKKTAIRLIVLTGAVIFVAAGWFWWQNVYLDSNRVFWDMIGNNLSTTGITRHIVQKGQSQSLDQYIQLQFGRDKLSHSFVTLTQGQNGKLATVRSESIGTLANDFNRYISIDTAQKTTSGKVINTAGINGVWSKSDNAQAGQLPNAQQLRQAVLTIVPFGNLDAGSRSDLVKLIKDSNVYDISTGSVKSAKINGHTVFVYEVSVNPKAYVEAMKKYAKDIGLGDIGLDSSQYDGAASFKIQMAVDKLSRQLVKVSFSTGAQEETYSAYGLEPNVAVPTNTIPLSELQNRVQQSLR